MKKKEKNDLRKAYKNYIKYFFHKQICSYVPFKYCFNFL